MAKIIDEITVQVSVETILQRALIETAEGVLEKHGARLNYVNFNWNDLTGKDGKKATINTCEINTTYTKE